jgi:hypothetical protein
MKDNKNISLDEIGNKLPFSVPENFFEDFSNQIDAQTQIKPVPIIRLLRPWIYMVAMFIAVFFVGRLAYSSFQNKETVLAENYDMYILSQIDENEIVEYYLANEE